MEFQPYNLSTWIAYQVGRSIRRFLTRAVDRRKTISPSEIAAQSEQRPYINASEIGDFVYCERLWWFSKHGFVSQIPAVVTRLQAGRDFHRVYTQEVQSRSSRRRKTRKFLIAVAILLLLAAIAFLLSNRASATAHGHKSHVVANAKATPKASISKDPPESPGQIVLDVLWSLGFLALVFYVVRRIVRWRRNPGDKGDLVYADDQRSELLTCHELGLAGKPDAIWRKGNRFIPEERKNRRLQPSQAPFENHVLQLIAYCHLVARSYGPVEKGVLSYQNSRHVVPYTEEQYIRLVQTLTRMRSLDAIEAHRNHASRAKCQACAASTICSEALR